MSMEQVGKGATFVKDSDNPGTTDTFAEGSFIATLNSVAEMTITSVATGTVNQTTDGYSLQCIDVGNSNAVVGDAEISIPGRLLIERNSS